MCKSYKIKNIINKDICSWTPDSSGTTYDMTWQAMSRYFNRYGMVKHNKGGYTSLTENLIKSKGNRHQYRIYKKVKRKKRL